MYELIADIMFLISQFILLTAVIKVNSLYRILFSYDKKRIPAKVQISVLLGMTVYMVSVFISFFSVGFLLYKFFNIIIPEEIPKIDTGLSFLIGSFLIYPQSSKLLNFITAYLKKHDLLLDDYNALNGDIENVV